MQHFIRGSILSGFKEDEFKDLPKGTKKKLIKLMSRISEKSYRRGFQHGAECKFFHKNIGDWRSGRPDVSKCAVHPHTETALDMFWVQNSGVSQLGFQDVRGER